MALENTQLDSQAIIHRILKKVSHRWSLRFINHERVIGHNLRPSKVISLRGIVRFKKIQKSR